MSNSKVQSSWFDMRSTELTPESHHDFILEYVKSMNHARFMISPELYVVQEQAVEKAPQLVILKSRRRRRIS